MSKQVYFEYMPLREGPAGSIYRDLPYGDLVDLIVLDTRREGREEQITITGEESLAAINDPERQLLGEEQEAWLLERLSASASTWKLLAQQVMMGQVILIPGTDGAPNRPLLIDIWDGYEFARRRVLGHIRDNAIDNVVVLTGDIHTSWAHELTINPLDTDSYDPSTGEGSIAVEFVVPGISSPGLTLDPGTVNLLLTNNPHTRYTNFDLRGYGLIDVLPERVQCDWWHMTPSQIESPSPSEPSYAASWAVQSGVPTLTEVAGASAEKLDPPPLAP